MTLILLTNIDGKDKLNFAASYIFFENKIIKRYEVIFNNKILAYSTTLKYAYSDYKCMLPKDE